MEARPGTYVLIMRCDLSMQVQIGRWGALEVRPGYYLYVGSAFGPGGVKARVSRHAHKGKALRWHVDYLREVTELEAVWYSHAPQHLEHDWAQALASRQGMEAVKGFGCSDCRCEAHLFYTDQEPDFGKFERMLELRLCFVRGGIDDALPPPRKGKAQSSRMRRYPEVVRFKV